MNEEEDKKEEKIDIEEKCQEYLNGWKRERADFLNYKKEETERISQMIKYANEELILKILPILDNIYLAESHIADPGFLQIKKQFLDILQKEGIEPIEVLGKQFDPNLMEAIEEVSGVPDSAEPSAKPGIVIEEVQAGYALHGKVLRPAKVKVSK
jgi:molecular chaperone GrpE